MTTAAAVRRRGVAVAALVRTRGQLTLRQATLDDAAAIHDLIATHLDEGHLLPRQLDDVRVPHEWLPKKVSTDCSTCVLFRRCGQYAVMFSLNAKRMSLHG
jgi:hypothetical protein